MFFDTSKAIIEKLNDELFKEKQVEVSVLRLDKIHPLVSGNKLFKLHYFLQQALNSNHRRILTFGGAYSNHLSATAHACRLLQLKSIGIVRGEEPAQLSHTLRQCRDDGMQLRFVSRNEYADKENEVYINDLRASLGDCTIIPEGGYHPLGAQGAAMIMQLVKENNYTHLCLATGTATTLAGILMAATSRQTVIGFPALKGITDNKTRIKELTGQPAAFKNLAIFNEYHFGGYAKKSAALIDFINQCRLQYNLPLDFVYTGKMFFGVIDSIKKDIFPEGSRILCFHTGGLQGNKSLPLHTLSF